MPDLPDAARWAPLVDRLAPGGTLRRAWPLAGGVSAQVTALEIAERDGGTRTLVVRQHGAADRAANPRIAADEYRLLHVLHAAGLPVPAPVYLDEAGMLFGTPLLVTAFVEGGPDFAPAPQALALRRLATLLARIHALDPAAHGLDFLPDQAQTVAARLAARPADLDAAFHEGRIRDTLAAAWPFGPRNRPVLLHGDFWPGNVLWRDGQVAAVLDWEDAQIGGPLADLANSRLEILWAFGPDALRRFTAAYLAEAPVDATGLPYWDLWATLRPMHQIASWGLDAATVRRMRIRLRWFIAQAFARLGE